MAQQLHTIEPYSSPAWSQSLTKVNTRPPRSPISPCKDVVATFLMFPNALSFSRGVFLELVITREYMKTCILQEDTKLMKKERKISHLVSFAVLYFIQEG